MRAYCLKITEIVSVHIFAGISVQSMTYQFFQEIVICNMVLMPVMEL